MRINVKTEQQADQHVAVQRVSESLLNSNARRTLSRIRLEMLSELALYMVQRSDTERMQFIQRIEQFIDGIVPEQMYSVSSIRAQLQPERAAPDDLHGRIAGDELFDELNRVVEVVTRAAPIPAGHAGDDLKNGEALASHWLVSQKTLSRWKSRGLLGFRAVDADGDEREVFSPFAVDSFARRHPKLTNKQKQQTRLTDGEKEEILASAEKLVTGGTMSRYQVAGAIASQVGRAIETVHSLLKRELENICDPQDDAVELSDEHVEIGNAFEAGASIPTIAARLQLSSDRVARILLERKVLLQQRIDRNVIDHESFHDPEARRAFFEAKANPTEEPAAPAEPNTTASSVFASASAKPLKPAAERAAFRDYNFHKHLLAEVLNDLDVVEASTETLEHAVALSNGAEAARETLVQANLRLVVHVARQFAGRSVDFFELISEGNVALINAIEHFDFSRGFKFSTYLTRVLLRTYSRAVAKEAMHRARYGTNREVVCEHVDERNPLGEDELSAQDARRMIAQGMEALTPRERAVLSRRFGLSAKGRTETLEQIGRSFGVSKERVRQLQEAATAKMRRVLAEETDPALLG